MRRISRFTASQFRSLTARCGGEGRLWLGIGETAFEQGVRWLILPVQSPPPLCASWGELYAKRWDGRSVSGVVTSGLRVTRPESLIGPLTPDQRWSLGVTPESDFGNIGNPNFRDNVNGVSVRTKFSEIKCFRALALGAECVAATADGSTIFNFRCLVPIFLPALLAIGCAGSHLNLNTPIGSRLPNDYERFYSAVASEFKAADLCEKISTRAIDEDPPNMSSTSWRISSRRSQCYFDAALQTKNEALCDKVTRIVTIPANASQISSAECHTMIGRNVSLDAQLAGGFYTERILRELGYSEEDVYELQFRQKPQESPVYRFFDWTRKTELFKEKFKQLPSYDEPYSVEKLRPANDNEILTEMVAVETSAPEYCSKISPNSKGDYTALRNECFFSIAQNANSIALCARIGPDPYGGSFSRRSCELQLSPQIRRKISMFSYGPVTFPTMARFVHALQDMGYRKPFLADTKGADWDKFYLHLMLEADSGKKQEFIKRVEALPTYTK